MTNTLLRLKKKLSADFVEIFRHVSTATSEHGIESFVIGATARDLIFEYVYDANIRRKTEDVDFGIAVGSWAEYESLRSDLIQTGKFRNDPSQEQRIWWKGGSSEMRVDLVPFGGLESKSGEIAFPPKQDFVMSTLGFREAGEHLLTVEIAEDLAIKVVSLPGLALLKFVAYNDRPEERRRDVQDIWFIAQNYLNAGNESRLYAEGSDDADLLQDESLDMRTVGARLLGRDISLLLNDQAAAILRNILADKNRGGMLERFADVIVANGLQDEADYDRVIATLLELSSGINERWAR